MNILKSSHLVGKTMNLQQTITQSLVLVVFLMAGSLLIGCTPKVEVTAPSEPVTINLNVKIEHEIRVKVEKDLEEVFAEDSGLF